MSGQKSVRILSGNLWNGRADAALLVERLAEWAVDIFLAQELSPEQADLLAAHFPHGKLEPARDSTSMGIAAKLPLEVDRLALPCRDGRSALVEAAAYNLASSFQLLNLHIAAPHIGIPWRTADRRQGQVRGTLRYLESQPGPVLLMGDLNSTPAWPAYWKFRGQLRDVALCGGARPRRTWGPTPAWPRLLRIDHVFARGLSISMLGVVEIPGSDHSGIMVELPEHEETV